MKNALALFFILIYFSSHSQSTKILFDAYFNTDEYKKLKINSSYGTVQLTSSEEFQVEVSLIYDEDYQKEIENLADHISVQSQDLGDTLMVSTIFDDKLFDKSGQLWSLKDHMEVSYVISVPKRLIAEIIHTHGEVSCLNLKSNTNIVTTDAKINLNNSADVTVSGSNFNLLSTDTDSLTINGSHAEIDLQGGLFVEIDGEYFILQAKNTEAIHGEIKNATLKFNSIKNHFTMTLQDCKTKIKGLSSVNTIKSTRGELEAELESGKNISLNLEAKNSETRLKVNYSMIKAKSKVNGTLVVVPGDTKYKKGKIKRGTNSPMSLLGTFHLVNGSIYIQD